MNFYNFVFVEMNYEFYNNKKILDKIFSKKFYYN